MKKYYEKYFDIVEPVHGHADDAKLVQILKEADEDIESILTMSKTFAKSYEYYATKYVRWGGRGCYECRDCGSHADSREELDHPDDCPVAYARKVLEMK